MLIMLSAFRGTLNSIPAPKGRVCCFLGGRRDVALNGMLPASEWWGLRGFSSGHLQVTLDRPLLLI